MAQFDWVDFYKAFAKALLHYKGNRSALIQTIKKVQAEIEINLPTLERDNQIVDIDPFTVFGLFNKSKLKKSNRIKIITAFARELKFIVSGTNVLVLFAEKIWKRKVFGLFREK